MTTPTYTPAFRKRRSAKRTRCLPDQADARPSQELATEFLVRGCEQALFDLRCSLGGAGTSREVRVGLAAAELLEQVLGGWRDTLRRLRAADGSCDEGFTSR
jgi:hypothetical protein